MSFPPFFLSLYQHCPLPHAPVTADNITQPIQANLKNDDTYFISWRIIPCMEISSPRMHSTFLNLICPSPPPSTFFIWPVVLHLWRNAKQQWWALLMTKHGFSWLPGRKHNAFSLPCSRTYIKTQIWPLDLDLTSTSSLPASLLVELLCFPSCVIPPAIYFPMLQSVWILPSETIFKYRWVRLGCVSDPLSKGISQLCIPFSTGTSFRKLTKTYVLRVAAGGGRSSPQEAVVWLWIAVPKRILGSPRIASTSRSLREATLSAMGSVHKLLPNSQNLAPNVPSPKSSIAQPDSLPLCSQRSIFTPPTSGVRFGHDRKPAPNICRKQGWIHQLLTSQHQTPDPLQSLSIVLVECAGWVRKAFGHWTSLPRFLASCIICPFFAKILSGLRTRPYAAMP